MIDQAIKDEVHAQLSMYMYQREKFLRDRAASLNDGVYPVTVGAGRRAIVLPSTTVADACTAMADGWKEALEKLFSI